MSDLCWRCQKHNASVLRAQQDGRPLEEQRAAVAAHLEHLDEVKKTREQYREQKTAAQEAVKQLRESGKLGDKKLDPSVPTVPNSEDITMHYSFDFAQQVHFPSKPDQPGPIYFMTPRKCGIFGVCCEGFPQQINYLIDESVNTSKGANGVISYLHHFFENYSLGETSVQLHCDNCSGQNKNKYMLWYLAWRVMKDLHSEISLHFMPAGHTKFAPDWCFGLLKKQYRRSTVECLADLQVVVRRSTAQSQINLPQLVGSENGEVFVDTYNWSDFFEGFKPLVGIKSFYQFRFEKAHPGVIFYKSRLDDPWKHCRLAPEDISHLPDMPAKLLPPLLSQERLAYLHNNIHQFIENPKNANVVCPDPVGYKWAK